MLFSHLFIAVHVHHQTELYIKLLLLSSLTLLPPHSSTSLYMFASVKIVYTFIFQAFRHYLWVVEIKN